MQIISSSWAWTWMGVSVAAAQVLEQAELPRRLASRQEAPHDDASKDELSGADAVQFESRA
jgi:hypothetical protein